MAVLCDVILPEGQTRKYIKTVFGIIVTLVMIQPLIGLISGARDFDVPTEGQSVELQQNYLDSIEQRKKETSLNTAVRLLEAKGIAVESCSLSSSYDSVSIKFSVARTDENEAIVKDIVFTYLPEIKLVTYWK